MSIECDYCSRIFSSEDAYLEHLFYDHEQEEVSEEDKQRVIEKFQNEEQEDTRDENREESSEERSETNLVSNDDEEKDEEKEADTESESTSLEDSESSSKSGGLLSNITLTNPIGYLKENKILVVILFFVAVAGVLGGLYMMGVLPNFGGPQTPTNNTSATPAGYENLSDYNIKPMNVGETPGQGTIVMSVDGNKVDFTQQKYQTQNESFHFDSEKDGVWHKNGRRISLEYALHTVGIETNSSAMYYNKTLYQEDINTEITYKVNGVEVDPTTVLLNDKDSIQIIVRTQ